MMRCLAVFGSVLGLAGSAMALTPPLPACHFETGPELELGAYQPEYVGNNFVAFSTDVMGATGYDWVAVLEYCPHRTQLVVRVENHAEKRMLRDASEELFRSMVYGSASYTMEQMRDALRGLGADANLVGIEYESCACATFAG